MIRVLLVDDHAVVRAGYRRFLERTNEVKVVAEASEPDAGFTLFSSHQPDVSVVDLSLPKSGGLALIHRMLVASPMARVLVFSMYEQARYASGALSAGARGYVTKRSPPEVLVDAVLRVHAGHAFLSPDMAATLAHRQDRSDPLARLSRKEQDVFRRLAEGQSVAEIAAQMKLSHKTVANYQTLIKEKLGTATSAGLVHLALRHGVIEPPQ